MSRVLLGSGGFRTPERVAVLAGAMRSFFGPVRRLLFVPHALADHDGYVARMVERGIHAGYELDGIHRHADPIRAVERAEAVFIGGGNTFRLLDALDRLGLVDVLRNRVRAGLPYLGISAGSNVACPTIRTTNDMPIVQPASLDALGLVPFQVNPHYFHGQTFLRQGEEYQPHFGETRDERIKEFHEMNDTPVVGLWEGAILQVEDGKAVLMAAPARVFRQGADPVHVQPGDDLDALLRVVAAVETTANTRAEIAYTVAATFPDQPTADQWLAWLRQGHIAAVLAGGATSAEVVELDGPAHAFEVRYHFPARAVFDRYEKDFAPRLRAEGLKLFPVERGIAYRRSLGTIIGA